MLWLSALGGDAILICPFWAFFYATCALVTAPHP